MIKKYIKESLKYILRSQLFVKRYVEEIEALYQMSPNELRNRNEKCFLDFQKMTKRNWLML